MVMEEKIEKTKKKYLEKKNLTFETINACEIGLESLVYRLNTTLKSIQICTKSLSKVPQKYTHMTRSETSKQYKKGYKKEQTGNSTNKKFRLPDSCSARKLAAE